MWEKARTAVRRWLACTHSGPGVGPHDGKSGPGLLSQVNGRVAGACGNASAPGTSLLRCCFQLSQDVEGAGQQPPSDGGGGDVAASAPGQLGVGAGEHGVALGRLGGLLQDPRTQGEPCLVIWPWRTLRSELRTWGVSPAQAHSLRAVGKRARSPISATKVIAVSLPTPGRTISAWTRGSGLARVAISPSSR